MAKPANRAKKMLQIDNLAHEGYRRAGMAFAKGINLVAAAQFNAAELALLNADPRLCVSEPSNKATQASQPQGAVASDAVADVSENG